jgi:vacuolar protein sorting-associated protein 1
MNQRCPMECRMSSSTISWSCQITLHFLVDANGNNLLAEKDVPFGPIITNKEDVELWIRRAQAAILSPHLPNTEFYTKTLTDLRSATKVDTLMLPFSTNTIRVEIKDPELTDLSFIDLPGNITSLMLMMPFDNSLK